MQSNTRSRVTLDLVIGLVLLVVAIVLPFTWQSMYGIGELTLFFIWATVVTQWNLVFGVAGIFSLAQMAIFAMGGYAAGMLSLYLGWSMWAGMLLGGLAAMVFSVLIGIACLRLRGAYVALLTLAIAETMYLLIITDTACFRHEGVTCLQFTGGPRGLTGFGDFGFRHLLGYPHFVLGDYFVSLIVLVFASVFSFFVIRSPMGLAFRALRDNPVYAVARGVNAFKYQLVVFGVSAYFTGLAGAIYAEHFQVMGANTLNLSLLLFLLSMMIIGGVGSSWGPIIGSAGLMALDEFLKSYPDWHQVGLGLILVIFAVAWPKGLAGGLAAGYQRLRVWRMGSGEAIRASEEGR